MRWLLLIGCVLGGALEAQTAQTIDRTVAPAVPAQPALRVPAIQMRALRNGIRVAVLENHALPIVSVRVLVEASALLDPPGKEGEASLTARMLDEGTATMTADQLSEAAADLGNTVSPMGFFTITRNVERSLDLMADQLLHPAFPETALARDKANLVAALRRAKDSPDYVAGRVFADAVYGRGHPYARAESEQSLGGITRADLVAFHADYYRPRNVTFVVSGDMTPEAATAALDRVFGAWSGGGKSGEVSPPAPKVPAASAIYLYDRPNSPQSVLYVGQLGPRQDAPDHFALELGNTVLGGAFNSRLNLVLREEHGYTYGAESDFSFRKVPQPSTFTAGADVATPKTDSALVDLVALIREIRHQRPVSDSELAFAKATMVRSLPRAFATVEEVAGAAATLLENNLPLDYYDHLTARFEAVTPAQARAALAAHLDPAHQAIVVVGDRKVIEPGLRAAGIAPIRVVTGYGT